MASKRVKAVDPLTPLIGRWLELVPVLSEAAALAETLPSLIAKAEANAASLREAARKNAGDDPAQYTIGMNNADVQCRELPEWQEVKRIEDVISQAHGKAGECFEQTIQTMECNIVRIPACVVLISRLERYRGPLSPKDAATIADIIRSLSDNKSVRERIVNELQGKLGCDSREALAKELRTSDSAIRAAIRKVPTHSGPTAATKILEACRNHGIDVCWW